MRAVCSNRYKNLQKIYKSKKYLFLPFCGTLVFLSLLFFGEIFITFKITGNMLLKKKYISVFYKKCVLKVTLFYSILQKDYNNINAIYKAIMHVLQCKKMGKVYFY